MRSMTDSSGPLPPNGPDRGVLVIVSMLLHYYSTRRMAGLLGLAEVMVGRAERRAWNRRKQSCEVFGSSS